jgi:hypothetical protein
VIVNGVVYLQDLDSGAALSSTQRDMIIACKLGATGKLPPPWAHDLPGGDLGSFVPAVGRAATLTIGSRRQRVQEALGDGRKNRGLRLAKR